MIDMLSPELFEIFSDHLDQLNPDAATGAHVLDILEKFIELDTLRCVPKVKEDVANAILAGADPVNVFFSFLPSAERYEKGYMSSREAHDLITRHDRALAVFQSLTIVYERSAAIRHGDEILQGLFGLLALARTYRGRPEVYRHFLGDGIVEELLLVALGITPGTYVLLRYPWYNQHTCTLLCYFTWVARGRKDSTCTIQKPWEIRGPAELRRAAAEDLSRLSINGLSSQGAAGLVAQATAQGMCFWHHTDEGQASSTWHGVQVCSLLCQETRKFCRLARLFKIAFTKFILCNTGMKRTILTVSMTDGIVKYTVSLDTADGPSSTSPYAGIPVDLDVSLPHVEAALHAYWCCAIMDSAKSLLEFFFRCE